MPVHVKGFFSNKFSNSNISPISKFRSVWYTVMVVCDRTRSFFRSHGSCISTRQRTGYSEFGTSFVDLLWGFSVLCLLCLCARLFMCALWSPAGKGLTSWLSFVVSNCESVTLTLVSWVWCGT